MEERRPLPKITRRRLIEAPIQSGDEEFDPARAKTILDYVPTYPMGISGGRTTPEEREDGFEMEFDEPSVPIKPRR